MSENTVQFLPFHAINEFMRADFRLKVVRTTLSNLNHLPEHHQEAISRLIRKTVSVPGFRNPEKAPTMVKVLPTAKAFEKNPDLVAAILAGWAEFHSDLRSQVFEVLKSRQWSFFPESMAMLSELPSLKTEADWSVLPLSADRTRLPGFLIYWPKDQNFEAIYETFTSLYPAANASLDEVSLMAVWLSNRLPYHIAGAEGTQADSPSSGAEPTA
jgi:hypothetical protein